MRAKAPATLSRGAKRTSAARAHLPLLALLTALALALRLYGIHWDQGGLFHPDERSVLDHVQRLSFPWHELGSLFTPQSTWNPAWFPYGSFPLYVLKLLSPLTGLASDSAYDLFTLGRALSAVADTITVLLVYAVGARFFGRWAGLLGAAFLALAPLHIQQSHFFVTDVLLSCLLMASFFFLARSLTKATPGTFALAGLFFGLALATKVSAAPFSLVFVAAALIHAVDGNAANGPVGDSRAARSQGRARWQALSLFSIAAGTAIIAFALAQPYALIDKGTYLKDLAYESQMVRRLSDLPYTRQYIATPAYFYHIQQLTLWGLGVPLGLLTWAGVAFSGWMAVVRRHRHHILLAAWVVPYFLVAGSFQVKFMRYMLPITPFMFVMAAGLAAWVWSRLTARVVVLNPGVPALQGTTPSDALPADPSTRSGGDAFRAQGERLQGGMRLVALGLLTLVLCSSVFYAFAYVHMYDRPHPATTATAWVLETVPPGTTLLQDSGWEEGFRGLESYNQFRIEVYDDDTPDKREKLIASLAAADYLLFYSNRQYGTVSRLPERYPVTSSYYQQLLAGELGFQLVRWEASYPNLFGISFRDDTFARPGLPTPAPLQGYRPTPLVLPLGYADESFTVYDHPLVLIFKKSLPGSLEEQRLFFEARLPQPSPPIQKPEGLIMTPDTSATQQAGGTWSQLFHRDSIVNRVPVFFWYLLVQIAFVLALPITITLFQRLPDKGYLLGKTLSFLLMGYIPWLLASLHILKFSPLSIVLGLMVIAFISAAAFYITREEILEFLRRRKGFIVGCEALFLVAFLGFYVIRTLNPDLWQADQWIASIEQFGRGGEKPMDFAYFNAVVRSSYMPPYDPWFSGGYMNYYYFGWFLNAVPTKLLGIVPAKAIVVAIPMFFALTVTAAFSLGYNLAGLSGRRRPPSQSAEAGFVPDSHWGFSRDFNRRSISPVWAGLAAALFVAVLGNLDGLWQMARGAGRVVTGSPFGFFDYWRGSRMMPSDLEGITEFPYWTFLFADPHAHLWVIPLTLLSLGLSMAIVLSRRDLPVFAFLSLGLTLGAILATNSWDVITYATLGAAAAVIGEYCSRDRFDATFVVRSAVKVAVLGGLSLLFVLPYFLAYAVPVRQDPTGIIAALPVVGKATQLFNSTFQHSEYVTSLWRYAAVHGLFLFAILSFLLYEGALLYCRPLSQPFPRECQGVAKGSVTSDADETLVRIVRLLGWRWLAYAAVSVVLVLRSGYTTAGLLTAMLLCLVPLVRGSLAANEERLPARLLGYAIIAMPMLLGTIVDRWTFSGDIGRLNTVFKFYLQAWVLFALASAYAVWQLRFGAVIPWLKWRIAWQGLLSFMVIAGLIYPVMATPVRAKARFEPIPATIDGTTYMDRALYNDQNVAMELRWDKEAIQWLEDNVQGSPVIVEGITPLYRWGGRVSVYTGLPAVIGWDHHQKQQRGDYAGRPSGVDQRRHDVDAFYRTGDASEAQAFLRRYGVKYVYVGQLERVYYAPSGLTKFDLLAAQGVLRLAYENAQVRVYEVG